MIPTSGSLTRNMESNLDKNLKMDPQYKTQFLEFETVVHLMLHEYTSLRTFVDDVKIDINN